MRSFARVSNLTITTNATCLPIVRDVAFTLRRGEVLSVIGESGAGKSTIGNAVIGLLAESFAQTSGSIRLEGIPLESLNSTETRALRGRRIASVFQDHTSSLDPLMSVGAQVSETIAALLPNLSRAQRRERAVALLQQVGIPDAIQRYHSYPHQLSGGQRQRVVIAIALAGSPSIIVADEPTSALDATVQKQVLQLLRGLVEESGLSLILITHDMSVIAEIADSVLVMKSGEVVECGPTTELLANPQNAYTRNLLSAVPKLHLSQRNMEEIDDASSSSQGRIAEVVSVRREPILVVENLSKAFGSERKFGSWFGGGRAKFAMRNIGIRLGRGEILGLVGESGSGKSTIGRILAGLETGADEVRLNGRACDVARSGARGGLLGRIQMIFQDPASSLNPRLTVAEALMECIRFACKSAADRSPARMMEMIDRLGLPGALLSRYPHQLSGGQKQRVCIARALLAGPELVIADEPTSALDVSVQAEILALLKEAVSEQNLSMIFISHDLAVVQELCDTVCVLKERRIEDYRTSDFVFGRSNNLYMRQLIEARPMMFTAEKSGGESQKAIPICARSLRRLIA
ncbi:dipeptide ABC transporter ATP-binding protein [Terrirubrum flagellatum]|uniref:dipeptide ABC transporter ATP-binding protein n=1 Tax=Terrirubrum flagellatum TaxID=2895980 RepID=UPI003CC83760